MDFEEIKAIVELMNQNSISEFEMEKDDFKIKLRRSPDPNEGAYLISPPKPLPDTSSVSPQPEQSSNEDEIASPMIGTFYSAPSPEATPYVEVGSEVEPDTVVCIIEAMKVMNEIKAEKKGIITAICAENAKPVEFGQALFKVKPR